LFRIEQKRYIDIDFDSLAAAPSMLSRDHTGGIQHFHNGTPSLKNVQRIIPAYEKPI
jgi:hypothetical protein